MFMLRLNADGFDSYNSTKTFPILHPVFPISQPPF